FTTRLDGVLTFHLSWPSSLIIRATEQRHGRHGASTRPRASQTLGTPRSVRLFRPVGCFWRYPVNPWRVHAQPANRPGRLSAGSLGGPRRRGPLHRDRRERLALLLSTRRRAAANSPG